MVETTYEVVVDHYSGPTKKTCRTKGEVKPLIAKMLEPILGGIGYIKVYKNTCSDVSDEFIPHD